MMRGSDIGGTDRQQRGVADRDPVVGQCTHDGDDDREQHHDAGRPAPREARFLVFLALHYQG